MLLFQFIVSVRLQSQISINFMNIQRTQIYSIPDTDSFYYFIGYYAEKIGLVLIDRHL